MPGQSKGRISRLSAAYIAAVVALGLAVEVSAVSGIFSDPPPIDYLWLALLTLLSGLLPIRLPKANANISVSETFVFCGTLLFGPLLGALLGFLDVGLMWLRLGLRRALWHRMLFSIAANPLAIWLSGVVLFAVAGTPPLYSVPLAPPDFWLIVGLVLFAVLYFLLNSGLVAVAIALEERQRVLAVWKHFSRLWLNYWAGASVAALLISVTRDISPLWLFVITPLMLVLFFTHRWATERVEKAEAHVVEMKRTFLQTIEALALAIDAKDQVTHGHIRRVQRYTMAVAEALGMTDEKQLDALRAAALLHDTGKLAVPEYILNKPGPLTAAEFERMKVHAAVGADILKNIDFPYPVEPIVRHHHEAWDGSGYPEGIRGADIPLGARILSVVDCYDALTSDRPYRPRMTRQHAEQVLLERRGKAYDPWVVDQFLRLLDNLEEIEAEEQKRTFAERAASSDHPAAQFDTISATTAEDRELNELRRDLARAGGVVEAADRLFRHLRRVLPAASAVLYRPRADSSDLEVAASTGVGSPVLEGLHVPIGERISGWVYAHGQAVFNSDATLELGPVAKTFSVPLRYTAGVPIMEDRPIGALLVFGSEPFDKDHRRILENAATLFAANITNPVVREVGQKERGEPVAAGKSRVH